MSVILACKGEEGYINPNRSFYSHPDSRSSHQQSTTFNYSLQISIMNARIYRSFAALAVLFVAGGSPFPACRLFGLQLGSAEGKVCGCRCGGRRRLARCVLREYRRDLPGSPWEGARKVLSRSPFRRAQDRLLSFRKLPLHVSNLPVNSPEVF